MKRVITLVCVIAILFGGLSATATFALAPDDTLPTVEPLVTMAAAPVEETLLPVTVPVAETEPVVVAEAPVAAVTEPMVTEPVMVTEPEVTVTEPAATVPAETVSEEDLYAPRSYCDIPLYLQNDYPHVRYGAGTIATSGCSITSLAMVATYLTGHTYMPDQLADYFADFIGNNMQKLEYASDMLQLPWVKAENFHVALQALKDGKVVIALMNQKSLFTDGQHFIVLCGMTEDGKILVNDPNADNYSIWNMKNAFINGFSSGDISCGYSGAWIYDPAQMPAEPFLYTVEEETVECRYPGVVLTPEEKTLLARMVWVEAQGESFEGQQAIAEVVLNRLISGSFQSSVKNIIYAENQFRSTAYLDDAKPVSTQYEAVERALNGPYVLPIDVVFFATYPVTDNVWGEIGGHVFCYPWKS